MKPGMGAFVLAAAWLALVSVPASAATTIVSTSNSGDKIIWTIENVERVLLARQSAYTDYSTNPPTPAYFIQYFGTCSDRAARFVVSATVQPTAGRRAERLVWRE